MEALSAASKVPQNVIQERLFGSGFESRAELGMYSADEVMTFVEAALEYKLPSAAIIDAWALAFDPDLDIIGYVRSFRVRAVLLTNNGPMLDACLQGPLLGLATAFSEIICSWHIQARKPDIQAFERAAQRLGCAPAHLFLLDDAAENVAAAASCDWDAECVQGSDAFIAAMWRRPELWTKR